MEEILKSSNEFNSAIKALHRIYAFKKKGTFDEEKVLRNSRRINIIMASDPIFIIDRYGAFFLNYADSIKTGDWRAVANLDFTDEKLAYKHSEDGGKHTYNDMDGKINFIKKIVIESDDNERDVIFGHLQTILSAYCKYVIQVKNKDHQD